MLQAVPQAAAASLLETMICALDGLLARAAPCVVIIYHLLSWPCITAVVLRDRTNSGLFEHDERDSFLRLWAKQQHTDHYRQ